MELNVSSVLNAAHHQVQFAECARLIPGDVPASRTRSRKPLQSTRPVVLGSREIRTSVMPGSLFTLLVPHPLRSRTAPECVRSICTDFAFITLNWLSVGALLLPLHAIFPIVPVFEFALHSCVFLIGMSLLHAALITLVGYTEGLYRAGSDFRAQISSIGKGGLWGSLILCFAYGLQGSHWTVVGLIWWVGLLDLGSMSLWRRWRQREPVGSVAARNVL